MNGADIAVWGVTLFYTSVALLVLYDCIRELMDDREDRRYAVTADMRIVSRWRTRQAWYFVASALCATLASGTSLVIRIFSYLTGVPVGAPHNPLPSIIVSVSLTLMLVFFWRGKRASRSLRREFEHQKK